MATSVVADEKMFFLMGIFKHGRDNTTHHLRCASESLSTERRVWAKGGQCGGNLSVCEDSSRANPFLNTLEAFTIVFPLLKAEAHWKVPKTVKGQMVVKGYHLEAVSLWFHVNSFFPTMTQRLFFVSY